MALGNITKLDTLRWSIVADSDIIIEVRDGIIAAFYDNYNVGAYDIGCATFSCDSAGNLAKLDEKTLTGTDVCAIVFSAIKISDGIAAFTAIDHTSPYDGWIATVAIAANGIITAAVIDTLEFTTDSYYHSIAHAIGDIYVIGWEKSSLNRSWLCTVDIDSSGNIGSVLDSVQPVDDYGQAIPVVKIANGIIAYWCFPEGDYWSLLETRSIAADGTIGAVIDTADWSYAGHYDMRAFHVSGTIYACSYREAYTSDGWVNTFGIAANGTITTVDIDTFEYEDYTIDRFPVGAAGGGIAIFFYPTEEQVDPWGHPGLAKIVDIDSSGNIGAAILDTETIDGVFADYTQIIKLSDTLYVVSWIDDDGYGQAASLQVAAATVYPSDAITRVTNLIHRYDRAKNSYTLELALGDVISDFGLPDWAATPQTAAPEEVEKPKPEPTPTPTPTPVTISCPAGQHMSYDNWDTDRQHPYCVSDTAGPPGPSPAPAPPQCPPGQHVAYDNWDTQHQHPYCVNDAVSAGPTPLHGGGIIGGLGSLGGGFVGMGGRRKHIPGF